MQSLESNVELLWPVKLGIVGNEEFRHCQCLCDALEIQDLGHLDLLEQTSSLVLAQTRDIPNRESVRAFHCDFSWFGFVQALHALDFGECHVISIFKAVAGLVEGGHDALIVDTSDDSVLWVLSGRIDDRELLAEIAEDVTEQAESIRSNKVDAFGVTVVADRELVFQGGAGQDNDLVFVELGESIGEAGTESDVSD